MAIARIAALVVLIVSAFGQESSSDGIQRHRAELEQNPRNSLSHFLLGELLFDQHDFQSSANEFRAALSGDPHPKWLDAWAHIDLGEVFDRNRQRERAVHEYKLASQTNDNTEDAQVFAAQRLSDGVSGADVSLHHVLARYIVPFRYVDGPKPILKVPPEYSQEARVAELEGTVTLSAAIASNGGVTEVALTESLGLGLDEAAKAAARRWLFEPDVTESGAAPRMTTIELDFLLSSKRSRWHLLRVAFATPEGASRPRFAEADYPAGDGIGPGAYDDAHLIGAMGRKALVTLSFDVDQAGHPVRFQVQTATEPVWGNEAISIVRRWRFVPGSKGGNPVSVPCSLDLAWGEKTFTQSSLLWARKAFETKLP
jgi:TonB family protein